MATYPIKVLKDETGVPFVPLVSSTGITSPDGTSLEDSLNSKLEKSNIIAGDNIILTKDGNNITITGTASGAANKVIDNLTTETANVGVLDAHQGYILNNKIVEMAETLEGGIPKVINNLTTVDTVNALSAYQGYLLNSAVGIKQDKIAYIGGYNFFKDPINMNHSMSASDGITTSFTDNLWKIVTTAGNGNWLSWSHGNEIEANFHEGEDFVFSMEVCAESGYVGKPQIYFKSGMGYYPLEGTVSTNWSILSYTGKWSKANSIQLHLGLGSNVGTLYIRKISFERGKIPTAGTRYDIKSVEGTQPLHTNFPNQQNFIPDMLFLSYWNGAYNANGTSNLAYCKHGAIGTMATQNLSGFTMTGLLTVKRDTNLNGIKFADAYMSCLNNEVIIQKGKLRFGLSDSWDYNVWAGLEYNHSNKTLSLGLADGGIFTCNNPQNNGVLNLPGITTIYKGNRAVNVPGIFVQSSQPSATQTGDIWVM